MAHSAARSVAGSRTAAGGRCQVVPPRPRAARDTQQGLSLRRVSTPRRAGLVAASGSRRDGAGGFWSGVLVGGTVFGVLGFLFAPQVSRALLNSERMKKLLGDGSENLEVTREMLNDKISELNSAIDGVSQQLQSRTSGQESQVENL
ncbi:hypothetical protein HKI87_15g80700 [Chloropicon roscoffensis]|uniref:Uncharacterized protein n=2 Tax=Chloropicon roscoffensis TaxID=1461544 RepID=A0AAX4PJM9_9CHLO